MQHLNIIMTLTMIMIMTMIMSPIKAELISIRCSILDTKYRLQNFTLLNTYTFFRWGPAMVIAEARALPDSSSMECTGTHSSGRSAVAPTLSSVGVFQTFPLISHSLSIFMYPVHFHQVAIS